MIFDMVRSCYKTFATMYSDSDTPVPVRWYFCKPGALAYPFPHFMGSLNWGEDTGITPGEEVGAGRPYDLGTDTTGGSGVMFCGDPEWMISGIPSAEPPANPLSCCGLSGVGQFIFTGEMELFRGPLLAVAGGYIWTGEEELVTGPALPGASGGISLIGEMPLSTAAFRPSIGTGLVLAGETTLEVDDVLPGMIVPYGGSSAPTGYLLCDGSSYSTTTYAALYAVIGTTFGGGTGTFNVPDLRGRVPLAPDPSGLVLPLYEPSLGDAAGEAKHQLVTSEMPSHSHTVNVANAAENTANNYVAGGVNAPVGTASTSSVGGDGYHNNVQPFLAVNFLIKT